LKEGEEEWSERVLFSLKKGFARVCGSCREREREQCRMCDLERERI